MNKHEHKEWLDSMGNRLLTESKVELDSLEQFVCDNEYVNNLVDERIEYLKEAIRKIKSFS